MNFSRLVFGFLTSQQRKLKDISRSEQNNVYQPKQLKGKTQSTLKHYEVTGMRTNTC